MKKATKGALAAAAAGSLMLGGAGSLAYWTATGTVQGGSFTAGSMTLTDGNCALVWSYNTGMASAGDDVTTIVPGDEITKTCTMDLEAVGDNLSATLDAPATVALNPPGSDTTVNATVATTYTLPDGADVGTDPDPLVDGDTLTSANDGQTITVTYVVTIPYGNALVGAGSINGNATQTLVTDLDDLTVTLTQDDPNA